MAILLSMAVLRVDYRDGLWYGSVLLRLFGVYILNLSIDNIASQCLTAQCNTAPDI